METTKSPRGRITVDVIGDLDAVRAADGAAHDVAGVLFFRIRGEAQQQPTPFRWHAAPSEDTDAFGDPDSSNYLELDGSRNLRTQVRAVVHLFGSQYRSGWATVGRGEPSCEPWRAASSSANAGASPPSPRGGSSAGRTTSHRVGDVVYDVFWYAVARHNSVL